MSDPDYIAGTAAIAPVALLISEAGGRRNAMTAACFSEVSHHPASVWISIRPETLTHELIEQSGRFTLVLLHSGQAELAMRCGFVSGRGTDKTAALNLFREGEFWHLTDAYSSIACHVLRTRPGTGDHTLIIGSIAEAFTESHNPIRRHLLTRDLAAPTAAGLASRGAA